MKYMLALEPKNRPQTNREIAKTGKQIVSKVCLLPGEASCGSLDIQDTAR